MMMVFKVQTLGEMVVGVEKGVGCFSHPKVVLTTLGLGSLRARCIRGGANQLRRANPKILKKV
jgi:hypothetical protein